MHRYPGCCGAFTRHQYLGCCGAQAGAAPRPLLVTNAQRRPGKRVKAAGGNWLGESAGAAGGNGGGAVGGAERGGGVSGGSSVSPEVRYRTDTVPAEMTPRGGSGVCTFRTLFFIVLIFSPLKLKINVKFKLGSRTAPQQQLPVL